jgi:hypothetical protein
MHLQTMMQEIAASLLLEFEIFFKQNLVELYSRGPWIRKLVQRQMRFIFRCPNDFEFRNFVPEVLAW